MFKNLFKPKPTDFAAPFKGRLMTLEEVPDPVFSSKSMGEDVYKRQVIHCATTGSISI